MLYFIIATSSAFLLGLILGIVALSYRFYSRFTGGYLLGTWLDKIGGKTIEELLTSKDPYVRQYGRILAEKRQRDIKIAAEPPTVIHDPFGGEMDFEKGSLSIAERDWDRIINRLDEERSNIRFWVLVWGIILSGIVLFACVLCFYFQTSEKELLDKGLIPRRVFKPSTEYYTEWVPRDQTPTPERKSK